MPSGSVRRTAPALVALLAIPSLLVACGSSSPPAVTEQYSSPHAIGAALRRGPHGASAASDSHVVGALRSPGGSFLKDRYGRVVFLHGVNAVYKYPPFELYADPHKPWNFNASDARKIASLGFNVVRLGILWEGLEPGHGGPNQPAVCTPGNPRPVAATGMFNKRVADAYLKHVAQTVDLLGRYHIYTLLDMHQDVYSQPFRGEGAPEWAVCTDDVPIVPSGGRWSTNYSNPMLDTAIQHFWANNVEGNLQGQYDLVWHTVAQYFHNNRWIAGYDPFNEPFSREITPDDTLAFAADLECFYTGTAHVGSLDISNDPVSCPPTDPGRGVVPTIESVDRVHPVFIEPDIYGLRHGKPNLLGPMPYPRLVFNFHVYCGYRNPVTGDPTNLNACSGQEVHSILNRERERTQLTSRRQPGGPAWFMSEFGATQNLDLLDLVTGYADVFQLSWIYWAWKYYDDPTGSTSEPLVSPTGVISPIANVLSRTYPEAVAGIPVQQSFDPASGDFDLTYEPLSSIKAPTVVFVPGVRDYHHGYCARTTGGHIVSAPGASRLLVANSPGAGVVDVNLVAGTCSRV